MRKSTNGKWIIEDERFKYIISLELAEIYCIEKYQYGFNYITIIVKCSNGKITDITIPRYHFNATAYPTMEDAMEKIVKHFHNCKCHTLDTRQRVFEYATYLTKHNPEKLI